jgi:AbrB family looped-hinge helix DNA binding protein
MEMAKVTSRGQITVPVAILRQLDLKPGDKMVFIQDAGGIRIANASSLTLRTRDNGQTQKEATRSPPTEFSVLRDGGPYSGTAS